MSKHPSKVKKTLVKGAKPAKRMVHRLAQGSKTPLRAIYGIAGAIPGSWLPDDVI